MSLLALYYILYYIYTILSESEVAQSCPTLCVPIDCSPPGSSVHGIFQAGVLEWVAISFSRGSSRPRDRSRVSCIPGRHFSLWASREAPNLVDRKIIWSQFVLENCLPWCQMGESSFQNWSHLFLIFKCLFLNIKCSFPLEQIFVYMWGDLLSPRLWYM